MNNDIKITQTSQIYSSSSFGKVVLRDFVKNKFVYLMVLPVLLYYAIFYYAPMYGAIIAFKDYNPSLGIMDSPWIGFKHFADFFNSYYFWRIIKNTFTISISSLIFGFPAPIILALLINELKNKFYAKTVQTITYLPHFVSLIVICGIIKDFTASDGIISYVMQYFGAKKVTMLNDPNLFVPIYVASEIWQTVGWGSIIYLAALVGIDPQLYEAAKIDGAGRWKQLMNITIPGIMPTIIVMLILRMGSMLNVGFEKIILLYSPLIYDSADVISSFVYRKGLQEFNYSFTAAVGLFNSAINFAMLITANWFSKKFSENSLW